MDLIPLAEYFVHVSLVFGLVASLVFVVTGISALRRSWLRRG